ncbi:MAG: nucleoside recognition domain-containing protein [Methanomicrobiales archaeon]
MADPMSAVPAMLQYLLYAVVLITAGLVLASIIAETGLFSRLTRFTAPLSRISGLSHGGVLSLLTMAVSPTAGKAMLAGMEREGTVDRGDVIPTLIMGTFPVVLGESLLRVQLPAALVLLGPVLGIVHVALNLLATLMQTAAALVYTHLRRRRYMNTNAAGSPAQTGAEAPIRLDRAAVKSGCRRALPTLRRVLPATILAVVAFWILSETGMLVYIGALFDPLLRLIGLPGQAAAALVAQFLHFSAGHAVVAGLLAEGVLTFEQAVVTLILGSMVIITMIYAKYSIPLYLSLFGRYGVRVAAVTYATSMGAKTLTILLVMAVL